MARITLAAYLLFGLLTAPLAGAADAPQDPVRQAISRAVELLQNSDKPLPEQFRAPAREQSESFAEEIIRLQKEVALSEYHLSQCLENMHAMTEDRRRAGRSVQATFDFTLARLQGRIAFLQEYNYLLAQLRKDAPPLDPKLHVGWQLTPRQGGPSSREAHKAIHTARSLLEQLAQDHAGTPWELLARREMLTRVSMQWEPVGER